MNINELTIGEVREITALFGNKPQCQDNPYPVGKNIFIRTITHHYTGVLVSVGTQELVLEKAAWIADDGRLTDALNTGNFNEVEIFPVGNRVIIGRGSIIDATEIATIPSSQK